MSAERHIKQAIIAALCDHPDQDKYKARAFAGDNLQNILGVLSDKDSQLTKADFLTPDDEGKFIIDSVGFWKNYAKIHDLLQKKGEAFSEADLIKSLNGRDDGRTLLESAQSHGGVVELFKPAVWTGRFDEMQALWYRVPHTIRQLHFNKNPQIDLDVKRSLLAAEGRVMPEDALIAAGVKVEDVIRINSLQSYEDVKRKLVAHGHNFTKDHLLLTDSEGDTLFYGQGGWDIYKKIVSDLMVQGQKLEIDELTRHVGSRPNLLTRASERKSLHVVFTADHWVGRLDDMMQLWNAVLPAWKVGLIAGKEFDLAYAEAESLTYRSALQLDAVKGSESLLTAFNTAASGGKAVLPLGLKSTWDGIEKIEKSITDAKGKSLTVSDLRQTSGGLGYTVLMAAAKFGHFSKVVDISRQSGEALQVSDFLQKDNHGNTLLSLLAAQNELKQVFSPELWSGRVNEMKQLWAQVRVSDQSQVNFQQAEVAVKQATLKQQNKPKFKFP